MLPGRTCTSKTAYFYDKTISNANFGVNYYFVLKILQKALYRTFPLLGQVTYKIYPKLQGFKRVLDLTCCKERED